MLVKRKLDLQISGRCSYGGGQQNSCLLLKTKAIFFNNLNKKEINSLKLPLIHLVWLQCSDSKALLYITSPKAIFILALHHTFRTGNGTKKSNYNFKKKKHRCLGKKAFSNCMPEGNSPLGLLLVCVQFIACSNLCWNKAFLWWWWW